MGKRLTLCIPTIMYRTFKPYLRYFSQVVSLKKTGALTRDIFQKIKKYILYISPVYMDEFEIFSNFLVF